MDLFHIIEDAYCVTQSKGVFRQRKVFVRGYRVFAQHGTGFIRLQGNGFTSVPTTSWEGLDVPPGYAVRKGGTGEPILVRGAEK